MVENGVTKNMKPVGVTFGGFVIEFSFENVLIITMVQNVVPTALRSLGDIGCYQNVAPLGL